MRRTKEEADITRQRLLLAALNVFSRQGYDATRLEDIAAEAEVTRGAIYHHFGGKAELYNEMVMEFTQRVMPIINEAVEQGSSALDKLRRLFGKPYIVEKPAADSVKEIIASLENGQHVILSFGEHESDLDYLLVSNLLTRKIRNAWEHKTNAFRTHGKEEPRQLIIVVEEAHKLLNREMAAQTTFATIARELRKYYVTLLIVDQRPSQIYDEVMSQLGTRISGWLGDEDDIHAVLSGLAGREALRGMLARLQPKEEVLLLGWGVPMPLPVRSRRYDEEFWKALLGGGGKRSKEQNLKELGF